MDTNVTRCARGPVCECYADASKETAHMEILLFLSTTLAGNTNKQV